METDMTGDAGKDRPLLTFLLLSYNQERFIREAVEGAFSQSYSPLEILLSDDCSPDGTFEIMRGMADAYRGPHRIVLNRNPANLGIGAHINRAVGMATGEMIVMAAGDDVSLDARTERCCREWVRAGRGACSIFSDAIVIDPEGRETGRLIGGRAPSFARSPEEAIARGGIGVAGCTHAFTRRCFDVFGPMDGRVVAEDMAIPFRSLLLGNILYVDEPLVRYRTHGGNISGDFQSRPRLSMRRREAENHEAVMFSWSTDMRTARGKGMISAERADRMNKSLFMRQYWLNVEKTYYESGAFRGLWLLLSSVLEAANPARALKIMERRFRTRS